MSDFGHLGYKMMLITANIYGLTHRCKNFTKLLQVEIWSTCASTQSESAAIGSSFYRHDWK